MAITIQAAKMLWGRAAARCSMPSCRRDLIADETMTDDPAIIGEMAHMVAEGAGGPRGDSPLTSEERDRYDNPILLCRHHHREVDAQPGTWPVDRLKKLKVEHEAWVTQNLPGYDAQKLRDDEILATYIDQWVNRAHLKDWQRSMQSVFADGQPSLEIEVVGDLNELPSWIHTRVWPDRYPTIKSLYKTSHACCATS
jgi:hypothetical protein